MHAPADFDYVLPPSSIAQQPADRRVDARMLVVADALVETHVSRLATVAPPGALFVVNDSKVVPARVHLRRDDGRAFELLVCEPQPIEMGGRLLAWVKGARQLQPGDRLSGGGATLVYEGVDSTDPRARWFSLAAGELLELLRSSGQLPLPPYIERRDGVLAGDVERYQTVYAKDEGSVAAPTAGLHFDDTLLSALDVVPITLHVGPGTFLPMSSEDVTQHRVGCERFVVSEAASARIEGARREGRPVVAVGTTTARTLETVAMLHRGVVAPMQGRTDLVITPQHRFSAVDWLLTNFHLPRSSLLMLVCAFGGRERVLSAYHRAVQSGFRFYSYGDCMLVARGAC